MSIHPAVARNYDNRGHRVQQGQIVPEDSDNPLETTIVDDKQGEVVLDDIGELIYKG